METFLNKTVRGNEQLNHNEKFYGHNISISKINLCIQNKFSYNRSLVFVVRIKVLEKFNGKTEI